MLLALIGGGLAWGQEPAVVAEARLALKDFERQVAEFNAVRKQAYDAYMKVEEAKRKQLGEAEVRRRMAVCDALRPKVEGREEALGERIGPLVDQLQKACAAAPRDIGLRRGLARIAALRGDVGMIMKAMAEAVALSPDDLELRFDRGMYAYKGGLWELAVSELGRCIDGGHKVEEARLPHAESLVWTHRFAEAAKALAPMLASAPRQQREQLQSLHAMAKAYVDFWAKEQALRKAEAAKDDLPRVKIVTSRGEILLELFENEAPNTVRSFVTLVEKGFFDGTLFHARVSNFLVQGGCPLTRDEDNSKHGRGHPGYLIPDELHPKARLHFRGSISMANAGRMDSNGSQFYLTTVPAGWMNPRRHPQLPTRGNTVFGRVLTGMDVVDRLSVGDRLIRAVVLRKRDTDYSQFRKRLIKDKPEDSQPPK